MDKIQILVYLTVNQDELIETYIDLSKIDTYNQLFKIIASKIDKTITLKSHNLEILYENFWIKLSDIRAFYFFVSSSLQLNDKVQVNFNKICILLY